MQIEEGSIKIEVVERVEHLIIYQYSRTRFGGWVKQGHVMIPRSMLPHLTMLAPDKGQAVAVKDNLGSAPCG